jgi:hypothetical protein
LQQRPSTQKPLAHWSLASQIVPLPFFVAHTPLDAQYSVGPHESGVHPPAQPAPLQPLAQVCVPWLTHVPAPSQVFARVTVSPVHEAGAHSVPLPQVAQEPDPSQTPVVPHDDAAVASQSPRRSLPAAAWAHAPLTQVRQAPSQAASQHTPSTQKPV